jgi:CBS domain containing-hemolysin-like protein
MKLKESQKDLIDGLYSNLPKGMVSIEDIQEHIMDECMDQDELFDLSDDEDGDLYQMYYNLIWDYVSEKMGAPF